MTEMGPPRWLHAVNGWLHQEPIATLASGVYWTGVLVFGMPLSLVVLWIQTLWSVLRWMTGSTYRQSRGCHPAKRPELDLAVVITGCDSGFGHELALAAADAGYTVFAGCLNAQKVFAGATTPRGIIPLQMDVTRADQVFAVVETVVTWLQEKSDQQRALHALVNNAGIGSFGLIDWVKLADFQANMDGTCGAVPFQ